MNTERLRQLFPTLEEPLFEELVKHGTIREVKAGDTLLNTLITQTKIFKRLTMLVAAF